MLYVSYTKGSKKKKKKGDVNNLLLLRDNYLVICDIIYRLKINIKYSYH